MKHENEQQYFIKVSTELRTNGLIGELGADLWQLLSYLALYQDENGVCFPSRATIAEELNISERQVSRRLKKLEEFRTEDGRKVIEIERSRIGKTTFNKYYIQPDSGLWFGRGNLEGTRMSPSKDNETKDCEINQFGSDINVTPQCEISGHLEVTSMSPKEELRTRTIFKKNQYRTRTNKGGSIVKTEKDSSKDNNKDNHSSSIVANEKEANKTFKTKERQSVKDDSTKRKQPIIVEPEANETDEMKAHQDGAAFNDSLSEREIILLWERQAEQAKKEREERNKKERQKESAILSQAIQLKTSQKERTQKGDTSSEALSKGISHDTTQKPYTGIKTVVEDDGKSFEELVSEL